MICFGVSMYDSSLFMVHDSKPVHMVLMTNLYINTNFTFYRYTFFSVLMTTTWVSVSPRGFSSWQKDDS